MMARNTRPIVALLQFTIFIATLKSAHSAYLGKFLGKLSELHHGVSGEVYAVDARTLHLKDFTYDGQGPAAYFFAGNSRSPGNGGFRLRDENGSPEVIRRYRREGVTLTLPEGKTLNSIKWFSVWCEEFAVNFGDVKIPRNFDYPRPRKIDALRGVHGISSDNIVIVDAQTLLVPNLSYDGEAPDAKFWVGRGPKPSPQGVRVPDENGKEVPLRRYDRKTVVLTLPGDLTVFDIGHFGIWCEAFTVDFGHTQIPPNLNVPPSLKMLGVSPQSKLNCEVLHDDLAFEVRWAVAGDSIVLQLVAKLEDGEYMSFGISGDETKSAMVGGDVVVAWVDKDTLKGYADDYYLDAKSQCSGPTGSCPDARLEENTNNIRLLNAAMVNGYSIVTYQRPLRGNDQFDRQIFTNESQPIIWAIGPLNQRTEVSFHSQWAKADRFIDFGRSPKWNCPMPETEQPPMKPVPAVQQRQQFQVAEPVAEEEEPPQPPPTRSRNQQRRRGGEKGAVRQQASADSVARDSERSVSRTRQSSRRGPNASTERNQPARQVPTPAPVVKREAWDIPPIQCYEPEDGVFYAQMGPTGGKRGYPAITGHVGWGISWYINGLLIPEVNVVRGKTYTFVVEGGLDPEIPAKFHPFYITDDPVGGYEYKTPEERAKIKIFAGARQDADGTVQPTGVGRLCHWTHQGESEADDFESFGAYQRTLELKCDQGEPGVIQFTPDRNTPDTVYYQCFTHRYLGWKINVLDSCDITPAGSELKPSVVDPKTGQKVDELEVSDDDLEDSPSIRVETRVKAPNAIENKSDKEINITKSEDLEPSTTEAPLILNTNEKVLDYPKTHNYADVDIPQVIIPNNYVPQQFTLQTEIPIFLHPQSSYFPQPYYFQNPEAAFSANYNPSVFPNFNLENPQQSTFKPSPTFKEDSDKNHKLDGEKSTTVEASTLSTNTYQKLIEKITTEATKEIKPELQNKPINKTTINLTPFRIPQGNVLYGNGKIIVSHPISSSPSAPVPHINPYQFSMPPGLPSHFPFKKPYHRPIMKPGMNRPFHHKFIDKPVFLSPMQSQIRPQSVIIMKRPSPQQMFIKKSPTTFIFAERPINKPHPNVEISPLQASTEKEPRGTTEKSYAPLIYIAPSKVHYSNQYKATPIRPAINTGFHPESVIVEGGFKPIVSKEIQDRIADNDGPELEYESEIGVIDVNQENKDNFKQANQPFGPMFIPSPLDKALTNNKTQPKMYKRRANKNPVMFVVKHSREERRDVERAEDEVAEAAERIDTFYLPPPNSKVKPTQNVMQPSNIDIPPGTVVTYDGKRVSGTSLTAKSADRGTLFEGRSSKAAELITKPQVVPFKGDLPPLDPKFIIKNAPQLQNKGVLNRDLDAPSTSYLPQDALQGSTKLILIRQIEDHNTKEETHSRHERRRREAHHTPEHTAEQEAEAKSSKNSTHSLHDHDHQHEHASSSTSTVKYSTFAFIYANAILIFSICKIL